YVAIYPNGNEGPILQPGDEAAAQEPFNLQDVARNASGFIERIDETAKKLNDAINDVRRLVLNEQTLSNLAATVGTFRQVSEDAMTTVDNLNQIVITNRVPAEMAVSNLVTFTEELKTLGVSAHNVIDTNAPQIGVAVSNVVISTAMLTNLLSGVQAGHGLAGAVLKDDRIANDFSILASNLALTSRNLNEHGLWRVIRGPKHPPANPPPPPADPGAKHLSTIIRQVCHSGSFAFCSSPCAPSPVGRSARCAPSWSRSRTAPCWAPPPALVLAAC